MNWFPAPSVAAGLKEADTRWPRRNKASDGTIGDTRHQEEVSDHNPDSRGMVHAFDLTHDPEHGVDTHELAELIRTNKDHRVRYVISFGRIFLGPWSDSVLAGGSQPWQWLGYHGTDPHESHMHVSVGYNHVAEEDTASWYRPVTDPPPPYPGHILSAGTSDHRATRLIQRRIHYHFGHPDLEIDGSFGTATTRAVRRFQSWHDLTVDGKVGPQTWRRLFE